MIKGAAATISLQQLLYGGGFESQIYLYDFLCDLINYFY